MVAVIATALGLCALAVVVLGYAVWQLRGRVDLLARQAVEEQRADEQRADEQRADEQPRAESRRAEVRGVGHQGSRDPGVGTGIGRDLRAGEPASAHAVVADESADRPEPVAIITDLSGDRRDEVEVSVSRVASVTLAGPLIKVAAFSHGLRRALDDETRMRIAHAVRRELKVQRKLRRRRRARQASSPGWGP